MIDLRKKEEFKLEGYLKEYKVLENIIDKSKENKSNDETIEDIELELDQVQEDIETKKESLNSLQQEILEYEKYIQKRDNEIQNRKICDAKESYNKRLDEIKEMKIDSEIEMIKKEISDHETSYSKKITVLRVKYNESVNHTKQLNIKKESIDELNHKLKTMNFSAECFDDHKFNEVRMNFDTLKDEFINISKNLEKKIEYSKLLEENIKLSKAHMKIKIIKEEIENFDMKEVHKLKQLLKECNCKLENASKAENVLTGEIKQLKLNSKKNQEELKMYKDAVFKYNECFLEMKYLEYAIMDVDKTITALDKSIVEFHGTKLLEINLCLKELWMNTYHGNEIDYIQLKSDLTSKTYNYRIVMYKEGVEMDMRGRCSAGQKMIASILIRLAITDAFCQSTIIALDEPTTNLDSENVESLATTLNTLSKERTNFQIILITHDEDFVSILTRNGLDCYYKIDKTTNKGSQITKVNSY
ncbi:RAD50 [Hepatospora eriocheir]|uniref:RAD50 n=1 Tax=Hepatospora eriocheir TaxID=1081669 RepID=A0A1X0QL46_9MICR|nr:RAD50 [Hepatospora eriocheir]